VKVIKVTGGEPGPRSLVNVNVDVGVCRDGARDVT
jgi:hypothetical protein